MQNRVDIDKRHHSWELSSKGDRRRSNAGFHALAPPTIRPLFHLRD